MRARQSTEIQSRFAEKRSMIANGNVKCLNCTRNSHDWAQGGPKGHSTSKRLLCCYVAATVHFIQHCMSPSVHALLKSLQQLCRLL